MDSHYIYPKSEATPMRFALAEFARRIRPTHDLTLNFHADYRADVARDRLATWYRHVTRRLFGRNYYDLPSQQLVEFLAFPEYSLAGHLHFHCPAKIPDSHLDYFHRIASARWKVLVPTGTLHLQPIKQTEEDLSRYLQYVTKSSSSVEVIHSSMLMPDMQPFGPQCLPEYIPRLLPDSVLTRGR